MGKITDAQAFAARLERVARQQGFVNPDGTLNKSRLGRETDPADPSRGRRRVQRHLSGKHLPTRESRDGYAQALGVDPSELPLPDDEPDDSVEAMVREARSLSRKASGLAARLALAANSLNATGGN